jgi:hypothetical protein
MYDEIKKNLIDNFFNRNYLWTSLVSKNTIVNFIKEKSLFPIAGNSDMITMNLGNDISIMFILEWETTKDNRYRLIKIS